jgi:flagellin-like protein
MGCIRKRAKSCRNSSGFFSIGMKKKGISPVIASVLLILLVLVMASLIFLWARGFVSEQIEKFGKPVENLCKAVDFDVQVVSAEDFGKGLEVVNRGDVDIYGLDVRLFGGGNSEVSQIGLGVDAGDSKMGVTSFKMKDYSDPSQIMVYPVLLGNVRGEKRNQAFTCNDRGIEINLRDVI